METNRPRVEGKFLFAGTEKLYIRGVTYGPFRADASGCEYHDPTTVECDFAAMAVRGINAVRTYTVPPRWLLDIAVRRGLRVMVGLPWEQHVTFLDDPDRRRAITARVRDGVRSCAGHPGVLCYVIGNEIPAPIVRWHGQRRIEQFLRTLYDIAKAEDPGALVTYVNYPSTEYLNVSFADFFCFNVYLERQPDLASYLARLQNLAGERPLVMAEIGLDSARNGEDVQAVVLQWQIRTIFAAGCAGVFVFAWTDEWHRGGYEITDWNFGLTDRGRNPKFALQAVARAFTEVPFANDVRWPHITVVVCTFNGAQTIRETLGAVENLDYPNYDVVVVNDGSTDDTPVIVQEYPFRLISTPNRGLSSARNTGLHAATGEIVAYTDDDAYPDRHWLRYIAYAFLTSKDVGLGGPNIPPRDGFVAECVANAPGGPVHVLLSDQEAEHIPGCNMAFRRDALLDVGGFDPQFRAAGDDVDVCWRLQERGCTLGFSPAAMVWHHRRDSIVAYWKQQRGYGLAEAMLERKWPDKYNDVGHLSWQGRLYGKGLTRSLMATTRVYQGIWGGALFQSVYQVAPGTLEILPLMPEWYVLVMVLACTTTVGIFWPALRFIAPLLALAVAAPIVQALRSAVHAMPHCTADSARGRAGFFCITALLHLLQPLARLRGRVLSGLTPWRRRGARGLAWPFANHVSLWIERWQDPHDRLAFLRERFVATRAVVRCGGAFDRWDFEVRGGMLGLVRLLTTTEEHGGGRQLMKARSWPVFSRLATWLAGGCALLMILALRDHAHAVAILFGLFSAVVVVRALFESANAAASVRDAEERLAAYISMRTVVPFRRAARRFDPNDESTVTEVMRP